MQRTNASLTQKLGEILSADSDAALIPFIKAGRDDGESSAIDRAVTLRAAFRVQKSVSELSRVLEESSRSADCISARLYALNIILVAATVVIAIGTVLALFK